MKTSTQAARKDLSAGQYEPDEGVDQTLTSKAEFDQEDLSASQDKKAGYGSDGDPGKGADPAAWTKSMDHPAENLDLNRNFAESTKSAGSIGRKERVNLPDVQTQTFFSERREMSGDSVVIKSKRRTHSKEASSPLSLRQMCLFSLLGALIFASKMAMAPLANIEPVSLMVILLAVVFGWKGMWSVAVYVLLEYLTWGIGLWSICYIYIWPLLFACARLNQNVKQTYEWALFAGGFGLAFGALCTLPQLVLSGWSGAFSWWIAGIPFDLLHGAGNFVMVLLLFQPGKRLLEQLRRLYDRN